MPNISPFIIGTIAVIVWISLFFSVIYVLGWYNLTKQAKMAPLLLPHIRNTDYRDADGSYPEYKGQVRTHYKILNRGDLGLAKK